MVTCIELRSIAWVLEARCVKLTSGAVQLHDALLAFGSTGDFAGGAYGGAGVREGDLGKHSRPRPAVLKVVVSHAERAAIEERAARSGLSVSAYLRSLGIGHIPKALLDLKAVATLVGVSADQGRLGGLLKLWLSQRPGEGAPTADVRRLLQQIEDTQAQLRSLVQRL
jgi:hypothetical protein